MPKRKKQKIDSSELISQYESFRSSIKDQNSEAYKGDATDIVIDRIEKLQQIYGLSKTTNSGGTRILLLDSEVFGDTSKLAAINARHIKLGDLGVCLNVDDYVGRLQRYMNKYSDPIHDIEEAGEDDRDQQVQDAEPLFNTYNWLKLGALYLEISSKPIANDFLLGPLETEKKKITARARAVDDTKYGGVSTTAKDVEAQDIGGDQDQNTAQMVKNVYKQFMELELDERQEEEGVNFFEFFVNPKSFGQSVENLFFTSFLVKDGKLKLKVNSEGIPLIMDGNEEYDDDDEEEEIIKQSTSHFIATFSYGAWQDLIKKHNIKECLLPHRQEEEDTFDEFD